MEVDYYTCNKCKARRVSKATKNAKHKGGEYSVYVEKHENNIVDIMIQGVQAPR
jgi:hypothetical protein